jgi:hypothetical protein
MSYDLANLPISTLLRPISEASAALARLDERIARSPLGEGFVERAQFTDACASLWIDGELVHLEDLVLHDGFRDIRTPTHELTIARDVLKTRRRISGQKPGWALSVEGLRSLRGHNGVAGAPAALMGDDGVLERDSIVAPVDAAGGGEGENGDDGIVTAFDTELAAIDVVLARSKAAIAGAGTPTRVGSGERISWSMIRTGTRMNGSTNGRRYCTRHKTCRRCCRLSSPSMPGTFCPFCSTRPGSAGCCQRPSCARPALPPVPISPPSILA